MSDPTDRSAFSLGAPLYCRRCERAGRPVDIGVQVTAWVDAGGHVFVDEVAEKGAVCNLCGGTRTIRERPAGWRSNAHPPADGEPPVAQSSPSPMAHEPRHAIPDEWRALARVQGASGGGAVPPESPFAPLRVGDEGARFDRGSSEPSRPVTQVEKRTPVGCTACTWTGTAHYLEGGRCPACSDLVGVLGEPDRSRPKHERLVSLELNRPERSLPGSS